MDYSNGVATVENPLRAGIEAIDNAGIDYDAYDKNNYVLDFLQNAWGMFTGDSNWGDSQYADNRKKTQQYAYDLFNDGTKTYDNMSTNDYIVADKIRNMYDVDEQKGIGFLTGAANWLGDQIYDNATQSDDTRRILAQLLQGGQQFDMKDGSTYTLGSDLYNAILNDDFDYVDNVLRTVGADLSASGKSWGDLSDAEIAALTKNYNQNLSKQTGAYDTNYDALTRGEASPITIGNRSGSSNGILFNENGKYNALAGNSNAANALDLFDTAATVGSFFIPGVGVANGFTKGASAASRLANAATKGNKAIKAAEKTADATKVATKGRKALGRLSGAGAHAAEKTGIRGAAGKIFNKGNLPGQTNRDIRSVQKMLGESDNIGKTASKTGEGAGKLLSKEEAFADRKAINELKKTIESGKELTDEQKILRESIDALAPKKGILGAARGVVRPFFKPGNVALGASGSDLIMSPINAAYQNATGSLLPEEYDDRGGYFMDIGMIQDPYSITSMR